MAPQWDRPQLTCVGCLRSPANIPSIAMAAAEDGYSPDDWVWREEGTLNRENGHFLCDLCYIAWGMPANPSPGPRWVAP
jgi:hypothetical protein